MTSWFFVHSKQALSIRKHNKSRQFIFADSFFGFVLCVFLMSIEWAPLLWNSLL
uniref:Uncharacterized protein n=1 Tax=Panagrolaimus sp. PS1159 TaxID=55785 RepID=A0AC35GPI5_9BILA